MVLCSNIIIIISQEHLELLAP